MALHLMATDHYLDAAMLERISGLAKTGQPVPFSPEQVQEFTAFVKETLGVMGNPELEQTPRDEEKTE